MPDDAPQQPEVLEPITTAPSRPTIATGSGGAGTEGTQAEAGRSVVNQWMNELTGQGAAAGIRVPTEAEVTQVVTMFPDVPRESIILALQRSPDIEHAVETLLGSAR